MCRLFHISRNTLYLWLKRKKKTGDLTVINNESEGKQLKIKDWDKFEQFVLRHNHKTQIQIAELWGDNLTQQNVSKACQKLGITRKKNLRL
ncbi:IS630 transposase-related protein [Trichodesmium erythraeum 21-75]|nr:IS630 transposase-related protein [Trichodesmium erythraeum 21-75]